MAGGSRSVVYTLKTRHNQSKLQSHPCFQGGVWYLDVAKHPSAVKLPCLGEQGEKTYVYTYVGVLVPVRE